MKVLPITPVGNGFQGYANNVNFGQRKRNSEGELRHTSPMIKGIPLATMIAMSPMTQSAKIMALEPEGNRIELVEMAEPQQDVKPINRMPKHVRVANSVYFDNKIVDRALYLIDTDNDGQDYEYLEYRSISQKGDVIKRGMIKSVIQEPNNPKTYNIAGIALDPKNLEDYTPKGIMETDLPQDIGELLIKAGKLNTNHGAFKTPATYKEFLRYNNENYDMDLEIYKLYFDIK